MRSESDTPGADATTSGPRTLEIHLEELGEHSWVAALANTVGGTAGSAQYRFVARPPKDPHRHGDHIVTGATFPVMRWQDLDDVRRPNAWIETAQERLSELEADLDARGWRRSPTDGPHWWSRTYVDR